ncbi:Cof-type HAD-IIB family hydrolase [Metabacillus herbersteinensis]|uniref:Cof-type HAD-IIB family hydrolase n=1 Tax=Metabacillus herbersteinensis TaxID=283816 RepID=A0ABV6GAD5_9BACI
MIKLFVSDLDGTLLNLKKEVSPTDIQSLKKLKESDVDICLATGRMDIEIAEVLKMIGETYHRISQNGAFVRTKDHQSLHSFTFEYQLAKEIFEKVRNMPFITLIADYEKNYTEKRDELIVQLESRMFAPIEENIELLTALGQSIIPSKISILGEYEDLSAFQKQLVECRSDEVETYISDEHCLDVLPKNISKGNALMVLMEHLGIKTDEIACIGDSFNDIPMFQLTPHSFAMDIALPQVKKEAAYVVSSVSEAIEKVLELNKSIV